MKPFRVLFTVDLSTLSSQVAPHVEMMGNAHNMRIDVLFVAGGASSEPGESSAMGDALACARRDLRRFMEESFAKPPDTADVVQGDPAEEILRYSKQHGVDIIIVGGDVSDDGHVCHGRIVKRLIRDATAYIWTFTIDGGPIRELRLPE